MHGRHATVPQRDFVARNFSREFSLKYLRLFHDTASNHPEGQEPMIPLRIVIGITVVAIVAGVIAFHATDVRQRRLAAEASMVEKPPRVVGASDYAFSSSLVDHHGMTKRQMYAGMVFAGLCTRGIPIEEKDQLENARYCWKAADALIATENE